MNKYLLSILFFTFFSTQANAQIIKTITGMGSTCYPCNDSPAIIARIRPRMITTDAAGNIYLTNKLSSIQKIDVAGIVTRIAGVDTVGYSGDNGPAVAATLSYPTSIKVNAAGYIYFIDRNNSRIRIISPSGVISTFINYVRAEGLALDALGNVYYADGAIKKYNVTTGITTVYAGGGTGSTNTGDGGPAIGATISIPSDLCFDAIGNLYICCGTCIRKVDTSGIITTIAGGGTNTATSGIPATSALFNDVLTNLNSVAVDNDGNVYASYWAKSDILKIDNAGMLSKVAGNDTAYYNGDGGPATAATLYHPLDVCFNNEGNMFIVDDWGETIREVVFNTTGINAAGKADDKILTVFPNPTTGSFTVKLTAKQAENVHLVITDALGRIVLTQNTTANKTTTIKLTQPKGYYLLSVSTTTGEWSKQVVIR